ncbi:hypothetical protein GCM10010260_83810 [Streptomyces filipinensis]|uniref:Uncharacterized protein n=1 Tax=Streptomyces filipinensis TaxID=66887 RepID=A0A918MGH7_9ACTN|nr:hypothetical protein [Streptomyces filipinensis]GGV30528.1 hypothetical protein GCM10010260_83810 [Streptomyces filipinensis]
MPNAGLDAAANSLRAWLNRQHFSDLTSIETTRFFTDSITQWAQSLGYNAREEVHLPTESEETRSRRLDLQLRHRSKTGRLISIEIDRTSKALSLDKLTQAAELGDLALWVRWSRDPISVPIPPGIRVIRAHVLRRKSRTGGPIRMSLQADSCG